MKKSCPTTLVSFKKDHFGSLLGLLVKDFLILRQWFLKVSIEIIKMTDFPKEHCRVHGWHG